MFTIKQVNKITDDPVNNSVRLYEGTNIEFFINELSDPDLMNLSPEDRLMLASSPTAARNNVRVRTLGFTNHEDIYCTIDRGVVFVMNAAGKTVDTFRLEDSDWY